MAALASLYTPRPYFVPFHLRAVPYAILVAHRRAGKTVAAVNDIIEKALYNTRESPRYAYIAPYLRQAKDIAWKYLKQFATPFLGGKRPNESELYVELGALPNSPRITIYGADNPDALRGIYLDGVVLDEYGNMRPAIFEEIIFPTLLDRHGWVVFMGTPNGPNHFRDLWYDRLKDSSWFTLLLPVDKTNALSPEQVEEARKMMTPEQFAQELLCSFEASVRGAIYATEMAEAQEENRIGDFPLDKKVPTDVFMDLGYKDGCITGFVQSRTDGILLGHAHGDYMRKIDVYIDYMQTFFRTQNLTPGTIWLPHDAKAKSLQTGRAIIDHFRAANLRPKLVPKLDVIDGIAAGRLMFGQFYINAPMCETFILAAKSYHREYDEETKRYREEPEHDWSSDWMDMYRYIALVKRRRTTSAQADRPPPTGMVVPDAQGRLHYGFSLNDIWDLGPRGSRRRYG